MLRRRIFARSHAFLTRHATLQGQDIPMRVRTSIAPLNNYLQSVNIQRRRNDDIGGVCEDVDAKSAPAGQAASRKLDAGQLNPRRAKRKAAREGGLSQRKELRSRAKPRWPCPGGMRRSQGRRSRSAIITQVEGSGTEGARFDVLVNSAPTAPIRQLGWRSYELNRGARPEQGLTVLYRSRHVDRDRIGRASIDGLTVVSVSVNTSTPVRPRSRHIRMTLAPSDVGSFQSPNP